MTEGELIFPDPIPIEKCTMESFHRVMRTLRDRYPDGWLSRQNKQLKLVKMLLPTGNAAWHIQVPNDDFRREGWACIEARRHTGEQILVEVLDGCFASEGHSVVGRISLMEFTELVVSEATGSMLREERPEASAREQEGLVGAPETEKTFLLDTSADLFAKWLADYTRTVSNRDFPTERGRIALQSAKPPYRITGPTRIDLEGVYIVASGESSEKAVPLLTCIAFKVVPLASERTKVIATCHQPAVVEYFGELLGEMKRCWPHPPEWMPRLVHYGVPSAPWPATEPTAIRMETQARTSCSEQAPTPTDTERWFAVLRERTEYQVEVKKSLRDLWSFLENQRHRFEETRARVMMAGPFDESGGINCVLKHVPNVAKRIPNELCTGAIRAIEVTGGRSTRLTFRLGDFPDSELFWQTVSGLLIESGAPTPTEADAGEPTSVSDKLASLRRQLNDKEKSSLLIEERMAQFVISTDVPLQLVREKKQLLEGIEDLKRRIKELERSASGKLG